MPDEAVLDVIQAGVPVCRQVPPLYTVVSVALVGAKF
jgi:hypothetical protein